MLQQETQDRVNAEVEAFAEQRRSEYAHLTREDLYRIAQGYSIGGLSAETKAVILEAVVTHERNAKLREVRYREAQVQAEALGFADSSQQYSFESAMRKLRATVEADVTADFIAKVTESDDPLVRASRIVYDMGWGTPVDACIEQSFAASMVKFVEGATSEHEDENGEMKPARHSNPFEALQEAKQVFLEEPLVSNRWRGGSSSSWSNAVDEARRDVASKMARAYYYY
jgi:hypothetical protein